MFMWGSAVTTIAKKVSSTQIHCDIPPHSTGLISLHIRTGVGFLSNKLQFTYEEISLIAKLYPTKGSTSGGTRIVYIGGKYAFK